MSERRSTAGGATSTSTTDGLADDPQAQLRGQVAGLWIRRLALTAVAAFVACGVLGVFGYRESTATEVTGEYTVELTHPSVTRGGVAADWRLRITRAGGQTIEGPVTIETSAEYLALFDQNAQLPDPDSTAQDARTTQWVYEAPDSSELHIRLDIRTQPDSRWNHRAVTTVHVGDRSIAELHYSTWIVP